MLKELQTVQGDGYQTVRSLFIVSLPRSLSSFVYHMTRGFLNLREPAWTSDGEILNADRYVLLKPGTNDVSQKFISEALEPHLFQRVTEFLDQIVTPTGYAYKDVVQPFVISTWLKQKQFRTIRIKRNVADVAYAMLDRAWYYPARLSSNAENSDFALVQGLVSANRALDQVPAQVIDFDQMITDEKPLAEALSRCYAGVNWSQMMYINEEFERARDRVLQRRLTQKYDMLCDCLERASGYVTTSAPETHQI